MSLWKTMSLATIGLTLLFSASAFGAGGESVLIRCDGGCSKAIKAVNKAGGTITYQYRNIDAIAASLPAGSRSDVSRANGVAVITKDRLVKQPQATREFKLDESYSVSGAALPALAAIGEEQPNDYLTSIGSVGALDMFGLGHTGDGVVTAVIDSGTYVDHFVLNRAGCDMPGAFPKTVIGGETYIGTAAPTEPAATSPANGNHGTWVGTTIAANVGIVFASPVLATIIDGYLPGSVIGGTTVPMVGVAPCSHIYALKVFKAAGGGAPTSDILAAMDRAITMRQNYVNGDPVVPVSGDGSPEDPFVYDSLNVGVINMSLGGGTGYAGNDLDDLLTEVALANDIVIVNSAGNEGHAAMTGGSAGTGRGTITSAAASIAGNERVVRDLQYGLGAGGLYRASNDIQVAGFSSRGPTADGRISTNATAPGDWIFVAGASGACCSFVSGTSFSAPYIAGAAALLRDAMPGASALHVRNALIETANPSVIGSEAAPIDQGDGYIDISAAYAALIGGSVGSDIDVGIESASVAGNIDDLGFSPVEFTDGVWEGSFTDLEPGEVAHIFIDSKPNTDQLIIDFTNITPELPPAAQNLFFGDDIFVLVQDAKTSDEAPVGGGFFNSDSQVVVDNPQTGLVRIGLMGDWTNAGKVSADVKVTEVRGGQIPKLASGKVPQGGGQLVEVVVPAGLTEVTFELSWNNHWGRYPTDDLDLIIIDPALNLNFDGATFNSPERATIDAPVPGTYSVIVDGFTVYGVHGGPFSKYQLTVTDQDGNSL